MDSRLRGNDSVAQELNPIALVGPARLIEQVIMVVRFDVTAVKVAPRCGFE
ncbi:MAG TPA: hypothetical protein VMX36_11225 [Sedimentisphaerales bacterium]|nr:hypothetical protein [Sedimentisphaerales bacterium]